MNESDNVSIESLSFNDLLRIGTDPTCDIHARVDAFNELGKKRYTISLQQEVFRSFMVSVDPKLRVYCCHVLGVGIMNKNEQLICGTNGLGLEWTIEVLRNEVDESVIADALRTRFLLGDPMALDDMSSLPDDRKEKMLAWIAKMKDQG